MLLSAVKPREKLRNETSDKSSGDQSLETVRALHQTIVSLRTALEQSRSELSDLRVKVHSKSDTKLFADTIERLALENHILRERVLKSAGETVERELSGIVGDGTKVSRSMEVADNSNDDPEVACSEMAEEGDKCEAVNFKNDAVVGNDEVTQEQEQGGTELQDTELKKEETDDDRQSQEQISVETEQQIVHDAGNTDSVEVEDHHQDVEVQSKSVQDSDNESEELDDIELIFTTDDTKELGVLGEDLVSITETENWATVNGEPSPTITIEKSTQFDEESTGLHMPWTHSVVVETDISKCGVIDENDAPPVSALRRNTLPSPMPYRPIIHKEMLSVSKSPSHGIKFSSRNSRSSGPLEQKRVPMRPILVECNSSPKRESEAQTDITALPAHWKSESYLAHKVSHPFTTLPSKFTLPTRQSMHSRPSLKLCDRNQDARRILLSDINFTSMVPELSRSADHLALESGITVPPGISGAGPSIAGLYRNFPRAFSYMKNPDLMGLSLTSPGFYSPRDFGQLQWCPYDCGSQGKWEFSARHQSPASSSQPHGIDAKRRHSMKPSISSLDVCRHGHLVHRSISSSSSWQSEPASPTHCRAHDRTRSVPLASTYSQPRVKNHGSSMSFGFRSSAAANLGLSNTTRARNKVSFQGLRRAGRGGQSLPDLRLNDFPGDSADSTDSLIDEAEDYVRRSIDSIAIGTDKTLISKHGLARRHSDPDPLRGFATPRTATPYLPKAAADLKVDHLVKVITAEGRVTVGKVRYIGAVVGLPDPHVGLLLPTGSGDSDGSFRGRKYFECDPGHAVFVPFKKVVMAWRI